MIYILYIYKIQCIINFSLIKNRGRKNKKIISRLFFDQNHMSNKIYGEEVQYCTI